MATARRTSAFAAGMGVEQETHVCSDCGYTHSNRKNFRRSDDGAGYTCSTGHYVNKEGETKRQANLYARKQ